jgi:cation transport ATPase
MGMALKRRKNELFKRRERIIQEEMAKIRDNRKKGEQLAHTWPSHFKGRKVEGLVMRLSQLLFILCLSVGAALAFASILVSSAFRQELQALAGIIVFATLIAFGLREFVILLAIIWKQADKDSLFMVGAKGAWLWAWALASALIFNIAPFNAYQYDHPWGMVFIFMIMILLVGTSLNYWVIEQRCAPTLLIGKSWISQWPFNMPS